LRHGRGPQRPFCRSEGWAEGGMGWTSLCGVRHCDGSRVTMSVGGGGESGETYAHSGQRAATRAATARRDRCIRRPETAQRERRRRKTDGVGRTDGASPGPGGGGGVGGPAMGDG
jgi:hypothetical protein